MRGARHSHPRLRPHARALAGSSSSARATSSTIAALKKRLASYRAGYRADERREIERALASGELLCVVATNALELGVDIGHLDATIHLGYPGSVASLRQQMGRAGRSGRPSVALLIAQDSPLEQHFVARPAALIDRPLEHAAIAPRNPTLLRQHLAAAAHEQPLRRRRPRRRRRRKAPRRSPSWARVAGVERRRAGGGARARELELRGETLHAPAGAAAAAKISLRDIDRKVVRVVVRSRPAAAGGGGGGGGGEGWAAGWQEEATLETMEESAAQLRAYTGAVLLHGGASY